MNAETYRSTLLALKDLIEDALAQAPAQAAPTLASRTAHDMAASALRRACDQGHTYVRLAAVIQLSPRWTWKRYPTANSLSGLVTGTNPEHNIKSHEKLLAIATIVDEYAASTRGEGVSK